MRMIDDDEIGLKETQKTLYLYKKNTLIRPDAKGVWANYKDFIPNFIIIGNCRLRNG